MDDASNVKSPAKWLASALANGAWADVDAETADPADYAAYASDDGEELEPEQEQATGSYADVLVRMIERASGELRESLEACEYEYVAGDTMYIRCSDRGAGYRLKHQLAAPVKILFRQVVSEMRIPYGPALTLDISLLKGV